ncbi:MAG: hypothetical protein WC450_02075 [Candidatus Omnitrophota bacterium]|jgi:DNA-directed RNA polymerase
MEYLEKWIQNLLEQPSLDIDQSYKVKGECKKHLGPRLEYATIDITVEPASSFSVEISQNLFSLNHASAFIESAVYGILDVIMCANIIPFKNVKIVIRKIDIDEIDSNKTAFRKAGRDAGWKIIELINKKYSK